MTRDLSDYVVDHRSPPDPVAAELIATTARLGDISRMQITPVQGSLLTMLARLIGARHAVEIGTFTGYSGLCVARGLPQAGRLVSCDLSEEWTSIARTAWQRAGVQHKIDLRLGKALSTVRSLPHRPELDLVFLDADRRNHWTYVEELLPRVRPDGLLVIDNVLRKGTVIDEQIHSPDTTAVREFNDRLAADHRLEVVMLPIADGMTLARKREL
ncbi:SAM-dependent methyltransferase [Streptomyces sp. BA2]|nr:class I SAM-dependent methyltransferase [Streptomyces sp. BA2]MWA08914.1 SAM-dependent methyltransferase [Streptomyces sp. BA2]